MEKHLINFSKLCRTCISLLGKRYYSKHKFHNLIENAFFITITNDQDAIQPENICQNCYLRATTAIKRGSNTTKAFDEWVAHSDDNCLVCDTVARLSAGAIHKIKKHKKHPGGRPKKLAVWEQKNFNALSELVPDDSIPAGITISQFDLELNSHISLCECGICKNILRRPLTIDICEHSFCFLCFANRMKGVEESESWCPTCEKKFKIENVKFSHQLKKLLDLLKLACINCKKKFLISDYSSYSTHTSSCKTEDTSSMSVSEIFSLTSEIPRAVEDATLHIIKTKLSKSNDNSIEFKSGGPWVRIYITNLSMKNVSKF